MVAAVALRGESADAPRAAPPEGAAPAAVQAIGLGTLRWYLRLAPAVTALLARPGGLAPSLRALLVCAAHQIEYSRNPAETCVHAAVDATRILGEARGSGLVNAVLRRFVRERAALLARVDASLAGRTAHPPWLVERLRAAWPEELEQILAANNAHPPLTLRVDLTRTTVAEQLARLAAADIDAAAVEWCPTALTLARPRAVAELPGFAEGIISVQDAGAQLAGPLLQVAPGMRVLDACAAPGGKTGQLLELLDGAADVTALDIDAQRLTRVAANLERLKRSATLVAGDARTPASFWDGRPYQRILLDAPCSASGVIRRHPDIKLLRRDTDIAGFTGQQLALLRAAAQMLAPGGRLLYVTCSVLPQENEALLVQSLESGLSLRAAARPPAGELAPGARECGLGVQLLPGAEAGTDGFYYACLEKTTAGSSEPRN
jgi:16S rRNA (cytosine967-C5)-methyltransferase